MKPVYITTAIDYANGTPHIGHAVEKVQADALARYHRLQGRDVYFVTGTDEHGQKIYEKAIEKGMSPQALVDANAAVFQKMDEVLEVGFNQFIRTTDTEKHWPSVEKMWELLSANGDLHKDEYEGLYCVGCEKFLTESDLVDGKCPFHDAAPIVLKEENYFFNIGKYTDQILQKIQSGEFQIVPESRKNEVINILKEKEQYVSFSRPKSKLTWGIPVPGDPDHVMYVWCDALTNYISALGFADRGELYQKYWEGGEVTQLIGKDISRFHTLIWPAMLLAAGVRLPDRIFIHGFISINGKRLSKSSGNIVDPFELVEKFGSDAVRYYLLGEISAYGDGDYSENRFKEMYTADLANGIGNLFSRVTNMVEQYLGGEVSALALEDVSESPFKSDIVPAYHAAFSELRFDVAVSEVRKGIEWMNKQIDSTKPWQLGKSEKESDKELLKKHLAEMVTCLREVGTLLIPIMPRVGTAVVEALNQEKIVKAEGLFPRLSD